MWLLSHRHLQITILSGPLENTSLLKVISPTLQRSNEWAKKRNLRIFKFLLPAIDEVLDSRKWETEFKKINKIHHGWGVTWTRFSRHRRKSASQWGNASQQTRIILNCEDEATQHLSIGPRNIWLCVKKTDGKERGERTEMPSACSASTASYGLKSCFQELRFLADKHQTSRHMRPPLVPKHGVLLSSK